MEIIITVRTGRGTTGLIIVVSVSTFFPFRFFNELTGLAQEYFSVVNLTATGRQRIITG